MTYPLDNDEFESNYNNIYPNELKLKKKNADPFKASFFDLSLEFLDRLFSCLIKKKLIAMYHRVYFTPQPALKIYVLSGQ